MSLHAKITPEAQAQLDAQKRASTFTSIIIALLACCLLAVALAFLLLKINSTSTPEIITYAVTAKAEEEIERPEVVNQVERKPSAPSNAMSKVIAARTTSPISIPVPEFELDTPALEFGNGNDFGQGWGSGSGSGTGSGKNSLFGSTRQEKGLVGTFYDFKRDRSGKPTGLKALDRRSYTAIVKSFTSSRKWSPSPRYKHYTSPTKLYAKAMIFKGIPDTAAGKAFQAPGTGPGLWLAHYQGEVIAQESGTYRFVGWGDNCLVVGINGNIVLDASDIGYTGKERTRRGTVNIPGKPGAIVFEGKTFYLRKGQSLKLDVLIGDEGGIFSAAAFLMKKRDGYKAGSGVPNFPGLVVAPLDPQQFKNLNFIKGPNLEPSVFLIK